MATRLERWRALVDLWNAGDVDAWFEAAGPRVEFTPDPRFPETGPFSGAPFRDFLVQWQQAWGGESGLTMIEEPFERSGAIVSRLRWDVSGASSGAHIPREWAEFTFVGWFGPDGYLERLLAFFDYEEALAAADAGREPAG